MNKIISDIKNNKIASIILYILAICLLYFIVYTFYIIFCTDINFFNELGDKKQFINIVILIFLFLLPIFITVRYFPSVNRIKHQLVLGFIVVIIFFVVIGHIYYKGWDEFFKEFGQKEEPFSLVHIAIALAALATAVFTWWRNNINSRIHLTQELTRQNELFAKAVEFLKDKALITRKAGVHILKDLACTSHQNAQKCIDMLCSLNESWMPKFLKEYPDFFEINKNFPNIKNTEELILKETDNEIENNHDFVYLNNETEKYINDIALSQSALQALSEIIIYISENQDYKGKYILSYKYLCSINLFRVNFNKKFIFKNANLQSANLSGANLQSVNLTSSNLQSADFKSANLESAILRHANFQNAKLMYAKFQDSFLFEANLQFADLKDADFTNARVKKTDFRNASNINEADFDNNRNDAIFTDEDYKRHYPDKKS